MLANPVKSMILAAVARDESSVMAFGSIARQEHSPHSDVDVLELAKRRARPYKRGNVNISVYDEATLRSMAKAGSLFVLHLITEGIVLRDPDGSLASCLHEYQNPYSYEPYRALLRGVAPLIDVNEEVYSLHWKAFNDLAVFLLRSSIYSRFAEKGEPTFSLPQIQKKMKRDDLSKSLSLKYSLERDFTAFEVARRNICEFLATEARNPFGTLEAFMTNASQGNPLVLAFGLRLLGRHNLDLSYDLLSFPAIA